MDEIEREVRWVDRVNNGEILENVGDKRDLKSGRE